jgi:hypothetical protein
MTGPHAFHTSEPAENQVKEQATVALGGANAYAAAAYRLGGAGLEPATSCV